MEKKVIVDNKAVAVEDTKTVFGFGQISNQTPIWVKNAFKLTIVVTSVVTFWVSGTTLIAEASKVEVMTAINAVNLLVLGVSRLFGVEAK